MLTSDVGCEETGPDREPTHIPARKEVIRAHVFLFARGPVGYPRQQDEIRRDHEDVDDAEVAHGFQSVGEKWPSSFAMLRDLLSGVRQESGAFPPSALRPSDIVPSLTGAEAVPTLATKAAEGLNGQ